MVLPYLQSDVPTETVVSVDNQKYQLPKQKQTNKQKQVKFFNDLKANTQLDLK